MKKDVTALLTAGAVLVVIIVATSYYYSMSSQAEDTNRPNQNTEREMKTDESKNDSMSGDNEDNMDVEMSVSERIQAIEALSMEKAPNTIDEALELFDDFEIIAVANDEDEVNLMGMGPENWHYSAEANITVVECNGVKTPIHVFEGDSPSENEIDTVKQMMMEMMEEDERDKDIMDEEIDPMEMGNEMNAMHSMVDVATAPVYEEYTENRYNELLGSAPVTLFFHADWCPTCKFLDTEINENMNRLPESTVILQVDYDTEAELKSTYNIKTQSTFVVLDANGEIVETLPAPDFDTLVDTIAESV